MELQLNVTFLFGRNIFQKIIMLNFSYCQYDQTRVKLLQCKYQHKHVKYFSRALAMYSTAEVIRFISEHYKESVLKQIPPSYEPEETLITITLKMDLTKIFRTARQMGTYIISQYPRFQKEAVTAINQIFNEEGYPTPSHGIHLLLSISNCPLPVQNVRGLEFQAAAMEQEEGVLVYLKQVRVLEVGAPELFLYSCEEVWSSRCQCAFRKMIVQAFQQTFLQVVKNNNVKQSKFRHSNFNSNASTRRSEAPVCDQCQKPYQFLKLQNQIYLNCQKITILLPKTESYEGIFDSQALQIYAESAVIKDLQRDALVNCCAYIYCKPVVLRANPKTPVWAKVEYASCLISYFEHKKDAHQLLLRSENSQFFTYLSKYRIEQEVCLALTSYDRLLENYNNLLAGVDLIKFAYIASETLTTLKLSLLNSVFNHYANNFLHVCLVVEDILMIHRALQMSELNIKTWPTEYDSATLVSWLQMNALSIVVLVSPSKKDYQLLEKLLEGRLKGAEQCGITVWLVTESNPKKQFKIDLFGVVLDLTTEKNKLICKDSLEEMLDTKLAAFLTEDPQEEIFLPTVLRARTRAQLYPMTCEHPQPSPEELQEQESISKSILQRYYLKSRDLKKTTSSTLGYLYTLARGFSALRSCMQGKPWFARNNQTKQETHLSILDCILAIFLDEESARHKFSNCNTVFGTEVSKLILNENACEISFWGYEETEQGFLKEEKNYLPKGEMFKRMLHKLNSLLYEDDLAYCDD